MEIIREPHHLQSLCWAWRARGVSVALAPTMGYFHAGHLGLMAWARSAADKVVVSLFVNPTQFGPNEDLDRYPRDLDRDTRLAEEQGADILFLPEAAAMYAPDHAARVEAPELAKGLCGASRPGHFRGVATVVVKLLLLSMPTVAVFGQKDWQQLAVIRRVVQDLFIPVKIEGRPTARDADGLALSSRNVFLSPEERAEAPRIHQGFLRACELARQGETSTVSLAASLRDYYAKAMPLAREDYLAFVDPWTLVPKSDTSGGVLIAAAFFFGKTRLIDNMLLE